MKRIIVLYCAFFIALATVSCSTPNVIVIDSVGAVIEGASVQPVSLSTNGSTQLTDKHGSVSIAKRGMQSTEWISVSKTGYIDSGYVNFNQPKPIRITLKK